MQPLTHTPALQVRPPSRLQLRGLQTALAGAEDTKIIRVTAVVDGLVARGLVERRTVENDRRRVDHVITDLGHRALETADGAVDARLHQIAGHLGSEDEADQAFAGLVLWRRALIASGQPRNRGL